MSTEKRLLLAMVVSIAIIFVWNYFLAPQPAPIPVTITNEEVLPVEDGSGSEEATEPLLADETSENIIDAAVIEDVQVSADQVETVTIDTDLYHIELTNSAGGSATKWQLKNFEASFSTDTFDLLAKPEYRLQEFQPFATLLRSEKREVIEGKDVIKGLYQQLPGLPIIEGDIQDGKLIFTDGKAAVTFAYADQQFGSIEKTFTFYQGSYVVDVRINKQLSGLVGDQRVVLAMGPGVGDLINIKKDGKVEPARELNGYLERKSGGDIKNTQNFVSKVDNPKPENLPYVEKRLNDYLVWSGLENNYFMMLAFGEADSGFFPSWQITGYKEIKIGDTVNYYSMPYTVFAPDKNDSNFRLYCGPKDIQILEDTLDGRLKDTVKFGIFGFVSRPALWVLQKINSFTNNYGFAIILFTILINLLLLPLIIKQRRSMGAMATLQPKIKEIQARHKVEKTDDIKTKQSKKEKLNQETMALYKQEGVNPMGGCLPLLMQMPILFALFSMFKVAIVLRKAPFIFFWDNLSAADGTMILPILMAGTMFLSQQMTPQTMDKSQAGMMKFLPIMMLFMFMSMASGLVLYWTVSSMVNLGIQFAMNKFAPVSGNKSKPAHVKKSGGKK
jgi:YidC/Oxa1 family membrane protein insertase